MNDQLDAVRRELRTELPGQNVRVTQDNGVVFIRGTVNNLTSSDRAVTIASTAGKVVNLLNVNVPAPEPQILLKVRFASIDRNKSKTAGGELLQYRIREHYRCDYYGPVQPDNTAPHGRCANSWQRL